MKDGSYLTPFMIFMVVVQLSIINTCGVRVEVREPAVGRGDK